MLSALLTALQTGLTSSKAFLLGSLLPALLFLGGNVGLAWVAIPDVRDWWRALDASAQVLAGTVAGTAALGLAVILSMLTGVLLEALEGRYWPLAEGPLARLLTRGESRRLERLEGMMTASQEAGRAVKDGARDWETRLQDALANALASASPPYAAPEPDGRNPLDGARREVRQAIGDVRRARLAGEAITAAALETAVQRVEDLLARGPLDAELDAAQAEALLAIAYARDRHQSERIRRFNQRQFSYPGVPYDGQHAQPANVLAPTRLGNVGRTMRSYALSRYGMDLDILWSRLQHVLQRSDRDFAVLQDAKSQLDCCVVLAWLTALLTAAWVAVLLAVGRDASTFALLAFVGPALSIAWYRLACQRYRVFADLVRAAVDVFRFDLLRALALPLPPGPDEECVLWSELSQQTGYSERMDVSYHHETGAT